MASRVHLCCVEDNIEENECVKNIQDKLMKENIDFTTENDVKANELEWKGVEKLISMCTWVVLFYTAVFMDSPQGQMLEAICIENALTKGLRNIIVLVPSHLVAFVKESVSVFPCVLMRRDETTSWLDEFISVITSVPSGLTTFDICYNPQHVNVEFPSGFVDRKYQSEPEIVSSENDESVRTGGSQNYRKRYLKKQKRQLSERIRHRCYGTSDIRRDLTLKPTFNIPLWIHVIPEWVVGQYAMTKFHVKNTVHHHTYKTRMFLNLSMIRKATIFEVTQTESPCRQLRSTDANTTEMDSVPEQTKVTTIVPKASQEVIPLRGCLTSSGELVPGSVIQRCEGDNLERALMLSSSQDSTRDNNIHVINHDFWLPNGQTTFHFSHTIKLDGTVSAGVYDETDTMCYYIKDVGIGKVLADLKRCGIETGPVEIDSDQLQITLTGDITLDIHGNPT